MKVEYRLWIKKQYCINIKIPNFDNDTVAMFLGNTLKHLGVEGYNLLSNGNNNMYLFTYI